MGVFFSYDKKMGDFDGHGTYNSRFLPQLAQSNYDMDRHLDNYELRLIYGIPITCADLGFELGFAHRGEDVGETVVVPAQQRFNSLTSKNFIFGWGTFNNPAFSLFPYMIPYDSSYWELFGKAGLEKKLNAVDIDWSVRGGYILSSGSENRYEYLRTGAEDVNHVKMEGDISGYRIGSDLWIRHQLNEGLNLPFFISIDYAEKHRDGDAWGIGGNDLVDHHFYQYDHMERTFEVKAGGGVEKKVNACSRVGAGLYYNYLQNHDNLSFFVTGTEGGLPGELAHLPNNQTEFPLHKKHRLILNLAGEQEVSSDLTLRGGLNFFYGWVVSDDYKQKDISYDSPINLYNSYIRKISLDGQNWGVEASLGATTKFSCFTLEPFLKAGYRNFYLSGNGKASFIVPPPDDYLDKMMKKEREEWCLGAGFSLLIGK